MEKNRVIIFTEGGDNIGFGHITRCTALYEEIQVRNIEAIFIVFGNNIEEILSEKKYQNIDWKNEKYLDHILNKDDYVIIDSYLAGKEIYDFISKKVKKCLYIDDYNRINYPNGIVVNPCLYSDIKYPGNENVKYLIGKQYIILRKEFEKQFIKTEKYSIDKILITLGGNDTRNLTAKLLKTLDKINPQFKISVVIGKIFDDLNSIKNEKNKNIELFFNVDAEKMRDLILNNDFVISGAGQSIYELLVLNTRFLPILLAENQKNNYIGLIKLEIIDEIIKWDDDNLNQILKQRLLSYNEKKYKTAITNGGSRRVIDLFINGYSYFDVEENDKMKIYDLSNKDYVRGMSLSKDLITLEEHEKWFSKIVNNSSIDIILIKNISNELLGQVKITKTNNEANIGISLDEKIKGKRLATNILKESIKIFINKNKNIDKIIAEIRKENIRSIKIFKNNNFYLKEEKCNILKYEYLI
jgi:spore coat polysaccharide biosynthesis predicted glycosyltransferase SpsG